MRCVDNETVWRRVSEKGNEMNAQEKEKLREKEGRKTINKKRREEIRI